jgi:hypothetical protein
MLTLGTWLRRTSWGVFDQLAMLGQLGALGG